MAFPHKSTYSLFADDCLFYQQIHSKCDSDILQNDLLCQEHWANKWFMQFNPTKCVILMFTYKTNQNLIRYTLYTMYMAKHILTYKKQNT